MKILSIIAFFALSTLSFAGVTGGKGGGIPVTNGTATNTLSVANSSGVVKLTLRGFDGSFLGTSGTFTSLNTSSITATSMSVSSLEFSNLYGVASFPGSDRFRITSQGGFYTPQDPGSTQLLMDIGSDNSNDGHLYNGGAGQTVMTWGEQWTGDTTTVNFPLGLSIGEGTANTFYADGSVTLASGVTMDAGGNISSFGNIYAGGSAISVGTNVIYDVGFALSGGGNISGFITWNGDLQMDSGTQTINGGSLNVVSGGSISVDAPGLFHGDASQLDFSNVPTTTDGIPGHLTQNPATHVLTVNQ